MKNGTTTKNGKSFSKQAVKQILTNEVYAGTLVYNKKNLKKHKNTAVLKKYDEVRLEKNHPGIVTEEDFIKVQEILKGNAITKINDSGYIYLLSGIIRCKQCGSAMFGNSQKSRKS